MKKILFSLSFCIFLFSCKNKQKEDFSFLVGSWHSIGTDSYETWKKSNDSIISETNVTKHDSTILLDKSCIISRNDSLLLISHINKPKNIQTYYLIKDEIEDCLLFNNENSFPQKIFYKLKGQNIYAFVINNGKKIEFLYEKFEKK